MALANNNKENKPKKKDSRLTKEYFVSVVLKSFTPLNLLLLLFFIFSMIVGAYEGAYFLGVLVINIAATTMINGRIYHAKKKSIYDDIIISKIVRDGLLYTINSNEIIENDIMILNKDDIIVKDSIITTGTAVVKESHITGSTLLSFKKAGDILFKGSKVVNGYCEARVTKDNISDLLIKRYHELTKKYSRTNKFVNRFTLATTFLAFFLFGFGLGLSSGTPFTFDSFVNCSKPLVTIFMLVIPLFLPTVVTFAYYFSYINLSKKNFNVNKFEFLDEVKNVDVVCFDKTGTLTKENSVLKDIVPLSNENDTYIKSVVFRLLNSTGDKDDTAIALLNVCTSVNNDISKNVISLSSNNRYSAATFSDGTFIMGVAEELNLNNKAVIIKKCEEHRKNGYHVLVLAKGLMSINGSTYKHPVDALALLILQEELKDDTKEVINVLLEQGVDVKIFSGDDAFTTYAMAKAAGLQTNDALSLKDLKDDDIKYVASQYSIFGDCNYYQKLLIVESLKEEKHSVMVIGDNYNDLLAASKADFSLILPSSHQELKNAGDVSINSKKIDSVLELRDESEYLANNIQKILSLFITKSAFGFFLVLALFITNLCTHDTNYLPFTIDKFLIPELLIFLLGGLSIGAFRDRKNYRSVYGNIGRYIVPGVLLSFVGVGLIFATYYYGKLKGIYVGIDSINVAADMSVLFFTGFSLALVFRLIIPAGFKEVGPFIVIPLLTGLGLLVNSLISNFLNVSNVGLNFKCLSGVNYLVTGIIFFVATSILFIFISVYDSLSIKSGEE